MGHNEWPDIMQIVGNTMQVMNISINVILNGIDNESGAMYSLIRFGLICDALNDYKWDIELKVNTMDKT